MIFFVDFEDSFSFNIISYLENISSVEVINYKELDSLNTPNHPYILVLGPGPGHIDEYQPYMNRLKKLYQDKLCFLAGICLGHQIILSELFHANLIRCKKPRHGRSVRLLGSGSFLKLNESNCRVQLYNSWTIAGNSELEGLETIFDEHNELSLTYKKEKVLTMQFHPESIGTSCPEVFFKPLREFLRYPIRDEYSDNRSKNLWNI